MPPPQVPPAAPSAATRRGVAVDAVIVAVAAALQLARLGRDGLWLDEASTAVVSSLPLPELVTRVAADNQAPLWFLVVRAATALGGRSELVVRLPSALAAVLAVAVVLVAGRRLLSPAAGRAAAVLLVANQMWLHYGREARGYALLMLLVVLGWWIGVRFTRRPGLASGAALVGLGAAMAYTHNLGGLSFAGLAAGCIAAAGPTWRRLRTWAVVGALAVALVAPWLPVLRSQVGELGHSFGWAVGVWRAESPWQPLRSWAAASPGAPAPVRNRVAELPTGAWVGAGVLALLAAAGIAHRSQLAETSAPVSLLVATAVPWLAIWAASWLLPTPIYVVGRVDAPQLPLVLLAAGAGATCLSRTLRWGALTACVALAAPALITVERADTRSQDRTVAYALAALRHPGEPVVTTTLEAALYWYSDAGRDAPLLRFPSDTRPWMNWSDGGEAASELQRDAAVVASEAVAAAVAEDAGAVWLLRDPGPTGDAIQRALGARLDETGSLATDYLGLRLVRFALPSEPRS